MSAATAIQIEPVEDGNFTAKLADPEAEAALQTAAGAARRFWLGRRAFRASVVAVESEIEIYRRALHRFERRTISVRMSPGGSRREVAPLPDPWAVDPWAVDPA